MSVQPFHVASALLLTFVEHQVAEPRIIEQKFDKVSLSEHTMEELSVRPSFIEELCAYGKKLGIR